MKSLESQIKFIQDRIAETKEMNNALLKSGFESLASDLLTYASILNTLQEVQLERLAE